MRAAIAISVLGLGLLTSSAARAANVRTDRPRLLFGNGSGFGTTVAQFVSRCSSNEPMYDKRCNFIGGGKDNPEWEPPAGGSPTSLGGMAAAALIYAQPQRCGHAASWILANIPDNGPTDANGDAHGFISSHGRDTVYMSIVRDWCDATLDGPTKGQLEQRIANHATWMVDHYGKTGPSTEPAGVFHDDYANIAASVAWAGLVLAGTGHDAGAQTFLAYADNAWKKILLPAMQYSGDWWPEGFTYIQPTLGGLAWYAAGWSTATDEDIYAYARSDAGDLLANYLQFFTYALRPDDNFVYFGDTNPAKQSTVLHTKWLVDMLNYGAGSPTGQWLSKHVWETSNSAQGFCSDVSCDEGWLVPLLYDTGKDATIQDPKELPTARWLGKGSNDIAILRSGWGKDDTFVMMSCGDYLAAHQHDEVGSFQIFRHGILTGTTGSYETGQTGFDQPHWNNYHSQHSVHANTLAVVQPGELFPTVEVLNNGPGANVNDGGQRVLRRTLTKGLVGANSAPDLAGYLTSKASGPHNETGDITAFEHAKCHDYVACDMTAAYDSTVVTTSDNTAKVKEVTRQLVFVRPEIVIVFDRVESTDPTYEKRFLLHAAGPETMPAVTGNKFTIDNGGGRLMGQTLLPASADLNVVTKWTVEGKSYDPGPTEPERGGNRVEVVPKAPATRDYFLHVLDATDPGKTAFVPATVDDAADRATVTITDGASTYVVSFNKTGPMGGHLRVTGVESCDQDLGAMAESPDGGPSGGTGSASTGGSGSGGGGGSGAGDEGGCGCRVGPSETGSLALAALGLAIGLAGIRRRRAA